MHMNGSGMNTTWPVVVISNKSTSKNKSFRSIPETFSEQFGRNLPGAMNDFATIYQNTDGRSAGVILNANLAILSLSRFMLENGLSSLAQFKYSHILLFQDFMRREYAHAPRAWRNYFLALGQFRNGTPLEDLFWPRTPRLSEDGTKTKAHSMHAYIAIGKALLLEIGRIRNKSGRLEHAMKNGKILTLGDMDFAFAKPEFKQNPMNDDDGHWITREDFIRTVLYYLPGWPVVNRAKEEACPWRVYETPRGRCLGTFSNKIGADDCAQKSGQGANVIFCDKEDRSVMNPGQLLLYVLKYTRIRKEKYFASLFEGTSDCTGIGEVIEYYYPTRYDSYCIYLYWLWLAGWNSETIASVAAYELGFGIDIMKPDPITFFTSDHIVIKGKKTRSQPEEDPKEYSYVSDKNDPIDLYCVLKDFYELTKPLRSFLKHEEKPCILIGVTNSSPCERNLAIFGPSHAWIDHGTSKYFFEKHHIYEDMQEFNCSSDTLTKNEDAILVRVKLTNGRMLRTTWESWLKGSGVSLTQRMIMMGHTSRRTTNTNYGGDLLSIAIRHRQLRALLNNVEELVFKGKLECYQQKIVRNSNKVVQIFVHKENDVFYCKDPFSPTWPGHENYVDGQCTEFDECLFCQQCVIIPESLPVLVKWEQQIRAVTHVGPFDVGDKRSILLKAIYEIFELCRDDTPEWQAALVNAFEIGLAPDFVAPEFNYRYGIARGM